MTIAKQIEPPYPVANLTNIIYVLSSIADSGTKDNVSIDDVKKHVRAGDLWEYIGEIGGTGFLAFDIFSAPDSADFRAWYLEEMRAQCRYAEGRESRKYAIQNRGICLLISYTAEIIQQGKDIVLKKEKASQASSI
jgi:hypothetical protein